MRVRRAGVALVCVVLVAVGVLVNRADAVTPVSPGSFTGYAFDTCTTPSQQQMDTWLTASPFWGVGVYVGGSMRRCQDQPNLTASWVRTQSAKGWKVLPIWVGPQAACTSYADRLDDDPTDRYGAARTQGRDEAAAAAGVVGDLAIGKRSRIWYDLEDFPLDGDDCRRSALRFLSAWTTRLHELGYRSGVYSNVAAAIHALDNADKVSPGSYVMPDQVWYARANGRADTYIEPTWVRPGSWPNDRVHQFVIDDASATYGGVTMKIDRNFMDVGRGSVAPKPGPSCGVSISFTRYRRLGLGSKGDQVKAVQCLLKQKHLYDGQVSGAFTRPTARAVRSFQDRRNLAVTGVVNADTWTVLLAEGTSPVLKRGSASNAVRRVQRALNAATGAGLTITGVFGGPTTKAVLGYQGNRHLPRTGVVAADTWAELEAGRR